jgi:hypothetical protein
MKQSLPTIASAAQPSLGARLSSPERHGATQDFARLGAGLGLGCSLATLAPRPGKLVISCRSMGTCGNARNQLGRLVVRFGHVDRRGRMRTWPSTS